ncbi:Uncharacterized protein dnm_007270 [Desulfonema magnum]|uniref:Uncharacterized protein n=1 Tax=Desulfonema magnum TaxID=45655 RepID=A0A975BFU6_9BACT|nr:Uncharacterized protein dnm_007270 [Desulfonema magnum]
MPFLHTIPHKKSTRTTDKKRKADFSFSYLVSLYFLKHNMTRSGKSPLKEFHNSAQEQRSGTQPPDQKFSKEDT